MAVFVFPQRVATDRPITPSKPVAHEAIVTKHDEPVKPIAVQLSMGMLFIEKVPHGMT
jgi:hypothetical protein